MSEPMDRGMWWDTFEAKEVRFLGQEWPIYVVHRWQTNDIGEKRLLDTAIYERQRQPQPEPEPAA